MDFLKNIGSSILDFGKSAVSTVGGLFNQGNSNLASTGSLGGSNSLTPTQAAIQSALIDSGSNIYQKDYTPVSPNYTPIPVGMKTVSMINNPQGTITSQKAFDTNNQIQQYTNNNSMSNGTNYTPANQPNNPNILPFDVNGYRSALPSVTGGTDNRISNKQSGTPYLDAKGKLVTPTTGFSGQQGVGGGGISSFSTPTTGSFGSVGSGGSSFTGTLSGTSGLSTPAPTSSEEDIKNLKNKANPTTTLNTSGSTGTQPPVLTSGLVPPAQQLSGSVPPNLNLGSMESINKSLDTLINNTSAFNSNDFKTLSENTDKAFQIAYQKYSQLNPTIDAGVKNDASQVAAVQSSSDPYGFQQQIDTLKAQDGQIMQAQQQRNDLNNQVQAITSTYKTVVEDIKNDTSLPAGVKQKRLDFVLNSNKSKLEGLVSAIKTLDDDLAVRNESINRQLGIAKLAQDAQQQTRADNNARLKLFVDSGAIGAFTDSQIKDLATATGMSTQDLNAIKSSAKNPNQKVVTETDNAGNIRGIDQSTGKVLWTLNGAGKTSTSVGTNQGTDNERALMTQFRGEQIVKDYNDILGQKGTIDAYIKNGVGGPADLALVFSFMKGLDPTSVVRESEYDNAAKSGNIFQGAYTKFNGYFKAKGGTLPNNVKEEFQNLVNQKLIVKQKQYNNVKSQYEAIADRQGLNKQNVVIDYASGGNNNSSNVSEGMTKEYNGVTYKVIKGVWTPQ